MAFQRKMIIFAPKFNSDEPMKQLLLIAMMLVCTLTIGAQTDVDKNIVINDQKDPNTFVLIISNENYKYEQPVPFALNDGDVFKQYCEKTLGIPAKNIRYAPDATFNDMRRQLMWLETVMNTYQGEARAIVYYSGHGMPSEDGKHAYLLPVDGESRFADSGLSTEQLYKQLGNMPSTGTIVLLDACFSGARRDGNMMASNRGVAIKVKDAPITGNMVVFSAAQGDETAYPYKEQKHGLFTYFVLSALQQNGGYISFGDLSDQVIKMVTRTSIVENDKHQTPTVNPSSASANWRNWMFAKNSPKDKTELASTVKTAKQEPVVKQEPVPVVRKEESNQVIASNMTPANISSNNPVTSSGETVNSNIHDFKLQSSNHHHLVGTFQDSAGIYPIELDFNSYGQNITDVIYKNVNAGGKIRMTCTHFDLNSITVEGKDGKNKFSISLESKNKTLFKGTAVDGNKKFVVVMEAKCSHK